MGELSNKVAVVTGGGNGLGRGACLRFAEEGARVVIVDISSESGNETLRQIKEKGGEGMFIRADVTKSEDVQNYVQETVNTYGTINVFFNNAGIVETKALIADYDEDMFDKVIAVNLKGVFLGLKYVLKVMAAQKSGTIINTASIGGLVGRNQLPGYVSSKHGVIGLTKVAAVDYAKMGIRVNAICPGPIDTDMMKQVGISPTNPQVYNDYVSAIPSGRLGQIEEVANLVTFLASDRSPYINGGVYTIDGGMTAI